MKQTCARCRHEGYDVLMRIVEVEPTRTVVVEERAVPERFRAEPRCLDRVSCDERSDGVVLRLRDYAQEER